ncbi:hypothetical protein F4809DRAFT_650828 [Biscogniauxia mediterranea]|nr:hypothetical protein F4809DRAFT_650828 [Biscogniauxia mediterranea]
MPSWKQIFTSRRHTQGPHYDPSVAGVEHPQGLEVVFEGDNPIVDIVAIHGLNGHREKTWTAKNGVHWLRDLLPTDLPQARICCWGYDANVYSTASLSKLLLYDHARALVSDLSRKRKLTDSSRRPIIFIAHNLGGIVLKSALIHSDAARQSALLEQRDIKLSTHGIIFMGTPHQGGNGAQLGRVLANVASLFIEADDRILKHLERDSEWLQQQSEQYAPISGDFTTKFAYEQYKTTTALGKRITVVPKMLAVVLSQADAESLVIHKDHRNMVKFRSKDDADYITIKEHLEIMISDAESIIQSRWAEEPGAGSAIQYVKQPHDENSAVIWLNTTDEILQEHPALLYLETAITNKDVGTTVKAVKRWLDEPNNKWWLIIDDKYDHPQFSANIDSGDNSHSRIPGSCQGAMIITTRSSTVDVDQTIRLSKLEHRRSLRQDPAAVKLVEKLDGLPFALSTAGTYLRRQISVTCGEYLKQYEESRLLLQDRSAQLSPHDRILYATWNVSYMHIEQRNKSAAMLLKLWAYFSREDLWYELLCVRGSPAPRWLQALTADKPTFEQGMRLLCEYGLAEAGAPSLEPGSESPGYSMHSGMHAWMEHALREAPDNKDLPRLAIACVSSHVLDNTEGGRHGGTQRRLSPHVDRCAAMMTARGDGEAAQDAEPWMWQSLGSFYLGQSRLGEAEHMYRRALRGKEEALGPAQVSTLDTVQGLGILYADQGRLGEAQDMYERALRGYAEVLGPTSLDTHVGALKCCANLGRLRCEQGRLLDARQCYLRAWRGYSSVFGPDSREARRMAMRLEEMESEILGQRGAANLGRNELHTPASRKFGY